jgi:hypothetical protein
LGGGDQFHLNIMGVAMAGEVKVYYATGDLQEIPNAFYSDSVSVEIPYLVWSLGTVQIPPPVIYGIAAIYEIPTVYLSDYTGE